MKQSVRPKDFFEKVNCAVEGVRHGLGTQLSVRLELGGAAVLAGLAAWSGFGPGEWMWLIAAVGGILSAELLNSAIERLADRVNPRRDPLIRSVKDMAAGAVLLAMAAGVSIVVLLFYRFIEPVWTVLMLQARSWPAWVWAAAAMVLLGISLAGRRFSRLELRRGVPSMQCVLVFGLATGAALGTGQSLVALLSFFAAGLVAQSRMIARIIGGWEALTGAFIGITAGLLILRCL